MEGAKRAQPLLLLPYCKFLMTTNAILGEGIHLLIGEINRCSIHGLNL